MPKVTPPEAGTTDYSYWVAHPAEAFTHFVSAKGAKGYPRGYVIAVITTVSFAYAVPPWIPLAIAYRESGFNPFALGDIVNQRSTSFGLFMLHEGGELPKGKDKFWAQDPVNNSRTAIAVIAKEFHKDPKASPGTIAIRAQRPAEDIRPAYKADVDRYAHLVRTKGTGALKSARYFQVPNEPTPSDIKHDPNASGEAIPQGVTGGAFTGVSNWLLDKLGLPNIGVILRMFAGAVAVLIGLLLLFHDKVSAAVPMARLAKIGAKK